MAIRNGSNRNHVGFKQLQYYGHSIPFLLLKSQCALLIHSMFAGDSGVCGPNSYRFLLERAIKGKFSHLNWRYQNYASSLQILDLTEFPKRIGQKKGNVLSCGCSSGCGSGHGFRTESGWFLAGISKLLSI